MIFPATGKEVKKSSCERSTKPRKALSRDLNCLIMLEAISAKRPTDAAQLKFSINLDWPAQITETEFFKRVKEMPKAKVCGFLSS
jgi:hypothetical protein